MSEADVELRKQLRRCLFAELAKRNGDLWWSYDLDGALQIENKAGVVVPLFYFDIVRTTVPPVAQKHSESDVRDCVSDGAREISDVILDRLGWDSGYTVVEKTCSIRVEPTGISVRWAGFAYTEQVA